MNAQGETHIACLTPPGRAALATLAVRGRHAWQAVRRLFRPRSPSSQLPEQPVADAFWLGHLGGAVADEVVVSVMSAGSVPSIEIHCHGGPEVVRLLLEAFAAEGVQPCSWLELAQRHAEPGTRACAEFQLAHALTVRTAAILLDQAGGAFDRSLAAIRSALEEGNLANAQSILAELERFIPIGSHLTKPWRVAILGAPNVGKSSLVNALAGFERSIVSATPGTTRDAVTTWIAVDGWPVELIDTAGVREATDDLESAGIERALRAARDADVSLWVLDASAPPVWPEPSTRELRFAVNKIDLPAAWDWKSHGRAIAVSARTGQGLEEMRTAIGEWLVADIPPPGVAVPFTAALAAWVRQSEELLAAGETTGAARLLDQVWTNGGWPPDVAASSTPEGSQPLAGG